MQTAAPDREDLHRDDVCPNAGDTHDLADLWRDLGGSD